MLINLLLASVILINFSLAAAGRAAQLIRRAALQGAILGLILLLLHEKWPPHVLLMAGLAIAIKGVAIPWLLAQALNRTKDQRRGEPKPSVGYMLSTVLLAGVTFLAFLLARTLYAQGEGLFITASLATLFTGFLLLTTRRSAILQVAGYLVLENGVFLFGLLLVKKMPLLAMSGTLLDLAVGIFAVAIVVNHMQQIHDSHGAKRTTGLK